MLRIGSWIEHPTHGVGRISNHNGTKYIVSFPSIGLREVESHDSSIREAKTPLQDDPIKAAVVKLRYFVGLTIPQAAEALEISHATAERHWAYSRARLYSVSLRCTACVLPVGEYGDTATGSL